MHSFPLSERSRIPDTIQKVVFEFPISDNEWILEWLLATGVHLKDITNAFRPWRGDPKDWEHSWMERVMGLDGPWR